MSSIRDMLMDFHNRFGVPVALVPSLPDDRRIRLRCALVAEESLELVEACFGPSKDIQDIRARLMALISSADTRPDIVSVADATADIAYVVEGTNLEFGIDSDEVIDEVHRSNMRKVGGKPRADGKVLKPDGWTPPNIERVLIDQGWHR